MRLIRTGILAGGACRLAREWAHSRPVARPVSVGSRTIEKLAGEIKVNALSMVTAEPLLPTIEVFAGLGIVAVSVRLITNTKLRFSLSVDDLSELAARLTRSSSTTGS